MARKKPGGRHPHHGRRHRPEPLPSGPPQRSKLTVLLGVAAVVLGLGNLVLRLWRGDGIGLPALLPIAVGLVAIALSGRLRRG